MLVARAVSVRLLEPVSPEPQVWQILTTGARLYHVDGALNDAVFVLQTADALALAQTVFNDKAQGREHLSRIEEEVLMRLIRSLAGTLSPICGKTMGVKRLDDRMPDLITFFEILIEEPVPLRLGIAFARDTTAKPGPLIEPRRLLGVKLPLSACIEAEGITARDLLQLQPGSFVRLATGCEAKERLRLEGRTIAFGTCGVRGDKRAFSVIDRASPR